MLSYDSLYGIKANYLSKEGDINMQSSACICNS